MSTFCWNKIYREFMLKDGEIDIARTKKQEFDACIKEEFRILRRQEQETNKV